MEFKEYLIGMLGKKKALTVLEAMRSGKHVVISGIEKSGKTTLTSLINSHGGIAVEDFETVTVQLNKPLNCTIVNYKTNVV